MGYELEIKLKEGQELDEKFKPMFRDIDDADIVKQRAFIMGDCLDQKEEKSRDQIYQTLTWDIKYFAKIIEEQWKFNLQHSLEEGSRYYCGRRYAAPSYVGKEDVDLRINTTIAELYKFIVACPTPDPLKDNERFNEFNNYIEEFLDYLEDVVVEYWDYQFIDMYKDNTEQAETEESY